MTSDPGLRYLARQLYDFERRLAASERSARLQQSTVGIPLTEDDDAPQVDLDVSGALFTGVEASADAMTALDKVARAARTYTQPSPPTPASQPDLVIPPGSLWTDTDAGNRQYRWEGTETAGAWVEQRVGTGALDAQLVALITMRFATIAERDALIPSPSEGMRAFVVAKNLDYQYAAGVWVPLLQFVGKTADQSLSTTTLTADADLHLDLVPGVYRIEAFLHVFGPSGGGLKTAWSYDGTLLPGSTRSALGPATTSTTGTDTTMRSTGHGYGTSVTYGTGGSVSDVVVREDLVARASTPGTLQLWWAQNSSDPGDTIMRFASRLYVTKVQ